VKVVVRIFELDHKKVRRLLFAALNTQVQVPDPVGKRDLECRLSVFYAAPLRILSIDGAEIALPQIAN
jgi:hypothetical protein